MKCLNCKYVFFTDEEDYLFCPNCYEPVEYHISKKNASHFYEKMEEFKIFRQKWDRCFMVLYVIFLIYSFGGFHYFHQFFRYNRWDWYVGMILLIIMMRVTITFGVSGGETEWGSDYLRELYGEKVLIFKTVPFLLMKIAFYTFVLLMLWDYWVPFETDRSLQWEAYDLYSEEYLAGRRILYGQFLYIELIFQYVLCIVGDSVTFLTHRKACEYNEALLEASTDRVEAREELEHCLEEMFSSGKIEPEKTETERNSDFFEKVEKK